MGAFTNMVFTAGVRDEKEVKAFLRSPNRKDWFLRVCRNYDTGTSFRVHSSQRDVAYLAKEAGLIAMDDDGWTVTEKGWALATELGYDKAADKAEQSKAKAIKDNIKADYEVISGKKVVSITIPLKITEIQVHKLIDSTTGETALDIECRFDRDAIDAAANAAMMEHANELGFGKLKAGGQGIYVTVPARFTTENYDKLHNIKYR
jgi:hypothetical protein